MVEDSLVRVVGSVVSLSLVGFLASVIAVGLIFISIVALVCGVEVG